MKRIITLMLAVFTVFTLDAQSLLIKQAPPSNNATSGSRAPNGSVAHAHLRASTIVRASELTGIASGTNITTFGFNLVQGAIMPVTGNIKIYLSNTTSTTYNNGTVWPNVISGMTLVYDGPITIPSQPGAFNFTLTSPFNYTGGGIYVAYEFTSTGPFVGNHTDSVAIYSSNNALSNSLVMRNSTTTITNDTFNAISAFRPVFNFGYANPNVNEAAVRNVLTLAKVPTKVGLVPVQVTIKNEGSASQSNLPVTLTVTGANTYTNTITIGSLAPGQDTIITFFGFVPTNPGRNTLTVTIPADDVTTNNTLTTTLHQEFTCNVVSYADTARPSSNVGFNEAAGLFLTRYQLAPTMSETVKAVNVYLGSSGIGQDVYAVVLDATGTIVASSDTLTISAADTSRWYQFEINNAPTFNGGITGYNFFVGLAQTAGGAGNGYFPVAYQTRPFVPANAFYTAPLAGGSANSFTNYTTLGVWMIEAVFTVPAAQLPPAPGAITGQSQICGPTTGVTYTIAPVTGANSYEWTIPAGATITTNPNSNTITVDYSGVAISDSITVAAVNDCGPGPYTKLNIAIDDQPTANFTFTTAGFTYTFTNNSVDATSYSWDFGTGDTSDLASPGYTFTQNGTFDICLTARNGGCEDQTCQTVTITGVGINDPSAFITSIYPNPASNVINIEVVDNNTDLKAVLYNGMGQAVETMNIEKGINTINTAHLPAGVYHIEIYNNAEVKNRTRVIIQK